MRNIMSALAIATSVCAGLRAQDPPAPPATGLIVGQIVDGTTGRPVPEAMVDLLPVSAVGARRERVVTDPNGHYFFAGLPAGVYNFRAAKAGYVTANGESRRPASAATPVILTEGQKILDLKISIWKFGVVTGTVTDEAGEPMPGIEVRAFRRTLVGGRPRFTPVMASFFSTDDRGVYRIAALPPGDYLLAIPSKLTTFPAAVMSDPSGSWMGSSEFSAASREISALGQANTQQIGAWVLQIMNRTPVPPAPVGERLSAYTTVFYPPSDGGPQAPTFRLGAGEERTANLQMRPTPVSRVSGTLTGPAGPLPRVAVRLVPAGRGESTADADFETASGVTDDSGGFTLFVAASGAYILKVLTPRAAAISPVSTPDKPVLWAAEPLTLGDADLTGLSIVARPTFTVSGRIEFQGSKEPPTPQQIALIQVALDSSSGGPASTGRADERGQVVFGAPGGAYTVRVVEPIGWRTKSVLLDGKDAADSPVELKSDAAMVVTFTDERTQISGVVRDDRNEPDALGLVAVFPVNRALWTGYGAASRRTRVTQTSKTGSYTITNLPAGDYFVTSIPDALADSWSDPKNLESLISAAARVTLSDAGTQTQDLRKAR